MKMVRQFLNTSAPSRALWVSVMLASLSALANDPIPSSAINIAGKKYSVFQPPYWVKQGHSDRLLHWIDNDRVIFVGGPFSGWDHNKTNPSAVYVFDLAKRTVNKLTDSVTYCFKPTEIRYTLKRSADEVVTRVIKRNSRTPETEIVRKRVDVETESKQKAQSVQNALKSHPLQCGSYNPRELAGPNWEKYGLIGVYPLLEGHGYLDVYGRHPNYKEPPFDTDPVRWFPPNGDPPVALPMPKRAVQRFRIEYSEWQNAYVLRPSGREPPPQYEVTAKGQTWPKKLPFPVWLLRLDGRVETQNLPYSYWIGSYGVVVPTRAGFLITKDVNTSDAGVYLASGEEYFRLVRGSTIGTTASPNGCAVAVGITTDFNNRDGGLKVVSFC